MGKRLGGRGCYRIGFIALMMSSIFIAHSTKVYAKTEFIPFGNNLIGGVSLELFKYLTSEFEDIKVVEEPKEVTKKAPKYKDKPTPSNNSNKTYMDGDCITNLSSNQYKLKSKYVLSDLGIWTVNERYCAAVGSYYTTKIGTEFDVVLTSGEVIQCILADCKADAHTDSTNRQNPNGSVVEFVVNTSSLPRKARRMGDLSYIGSSFSGEIDYIRIYD